MATLAVLVWAGDASAAAVVRARRALAPLQPGDEVWLVHPPEACDAPATAHAPLAAAATPAVGVVAARPGEGPATAFNHAVAASQAAWCLFWDATLTAAPGALAHLRRHANAAEQAAVGRVPPWPALLVGSTGHRVAAEPSPLAHFLAARAAATTGRRQNGDDVPADQVPQANWAAPRALLEHVGGFDACFGLDAYAVDFARRAYAAGVSLRACPDVAARSTAARRVAEAVARWRTAGRDGLTLWRKHRDPHAMDRLVQRLGPYRALLPEADALAAQLDAVDQRLVAGRRPHPAHIAGLQPSFANLYAVSVLAGVLDHPAGAVLWPQSTTGDDACRAAAAGRDTEQPAASTAPRRTRRGPRAVGPRRPAGAPRA